MESLLPWVDQRESRSGTPVRGGLGMRVVRREVRSCKRGVSMGQVSRK